MLPSRLSSRRNEGADLKFSVSPLHICPEHGHQEVTNLKVPAVPTPLTVRGRRSVGYILLRKEEPDGSLGGDTVIRPNL